MKYIIKVFILTISGMIANSLNSNAQAKDQSLLTVYYFHNTHRCATCNAIEAKTRETLDTYFTDKLNEGTIKLVVLNAEDTENKAIVEKYEVWGSSLMLVKVQDDKELVENLTDFAFANARNNPDKFIKELKSDIEKMLN